MPHAARPRLPLEGQARHSASPRWDSRLRGGGGDWPGTAHSDGAGGRGVPTKPALVGLPQWRHSEEDSRRSSSGSIAELLPQLACSSLKTLNPLLCQWFPHLSPARTCPGMTRLWTSARALRAVGRERSLTPYLKRAPPLLFPNRQGEKTIYIFIYKYIYIFICKYINTYIFKSTGTQGTDCRPAEAVGLGSGWKR